MANLILTNARIVTPDKNFVGSLVIEDGRISDVVNNTIYPEGIDLNGQWLIPGIIDIHTDYLEKEIHPRPSASFPLSSAFHYLDMRAASCGITTVFCAISFSDDTEKGRTFGDAINLVKDFNKIEMNLLMRHFLHARLDPNAETVVDYLGIMQELKSLYLIVYNENIPGERQFRLEDIIEKRAAMKGISVEEMRSQVYKKIDELSKINMRPEIQKALENDFIIGSHDDTTAGHVIEAKKYGATLSEMPTTIEAARKARELGMWICMGAPNYYRGGSHCGNLSCIDAMNEGLVDMLCSDYHFPALTGSVVKMINSGMDPSKAINYVTCNPARFLGFNDLGSIEVGKKADLVSFTIENTHAAVSRVYVEGGLKYGAYHVNEKDEHTKFETAPELTSR